MITLINTITVIRILLAPIILVLLANGNYLLCTILLFFAGLTDYLDGYLARKYNAESELSKY